MAFGSFGPTMFDNTSMGGLMPMMMQMMRQNPNRQSQGASPGMPPLVPPQQAFRPGMLNGMLGVTPGHGLLNGVLGAGNSQPGQPLNILPEIPTADDSPVSLNPLTRHW